MASQGDPALASALQAMNISGISTAAQQEHFTARIEIMEEQFKAVQAALSVAENNQHLKLTEFKDTLQRLRSSIVAAGPWVLHTFNEYEEFRKLVNGVQIGREQDRATVQYLSNRKADIESSGANIDRLFRECEEIGRQRLICDHYPPP
ncbi:hypothetical protein BDV96DRAFT_604834 [Lophiotrema nucula]|uniref:Uncharacterized protein n=1 Tax=Lophiotrema nucula TaxID=690887 RepID=A0A6A5YRB0_9PLEO|nr:hypothetical protein BDV96DRAFT_604834 [Lophiotrema nucula]